jgi:nucleotide-binding universal stress UspA family protein
MTVDRVMVPLDGSPFAEMALPKAVELLSGPRATLILVRAAHAAARPGVDPVDAQAAVIREAESYLAAVAARLSEQGLTRILRSVWYSTAAKAIVDAARLRRADLIVMSTHGRRGLERAFKGSVAEAVLRGTRTPILLVQAAGGRHGRAATAHAAEADRPSGIAVAMASSGPSGSSGSSGRG